MNINEIFLTFQGEGKLTGRLSIFIRTNYCNLRCGFNNGDDKLVLCDTKYTSWYPEQKTKMTIEEIINKIDEIIKKENITEYVDVVITGGEPMMIKDDIINLTKAIKDYMEQNILSSKTTIESNGTFFREEILKYVDLFSLSPKLKSSVPVGTEFEHLHNTNRINRESFKQFSNLFIRSDAPYDVQWKFVISKEEDIDEILKMKNDYRIYSDHIYFMPMGSTKEELEKTRLLTWNLALKYHVNFTDRVHISIFDNKRGV